MNARDTLVKAGTMTNNCVNFTPASAGLRYYDVVHPVVGITTLTEFYFHSALRQANFFFQADHISANGLNYRWITHPGNFLPEEKLSRFSDA